jgi:hypothetical protein
MRSIGFLELLTILGALLIPFVLLPVIALQVWRDVRLREMAGGSRTCSHCKQRIPDLGAFCPICGEKLTVA